MQNKQSKWIQYSQQVLFTLLTAYHVIARTWQITKCVSTHQVGCIEIAKTMVLVLDEKKSDNQRNLEVNPNLLVIVY
jgi:hypothetical protein